MKKLYLITPFFILSLFIYSIIQNQSLNSENQLLTEYKQELESRYQESESRYQESEKESRIRNQFLISKNQSLKSKNQFFNQENQLLINNNQLLLKNKNNYVNCIAATCRISGRGTGCCFLENKDNILILTNAHVVGNYSQVYCEFWRKGYLLKPIKGKIIIKDTKRDVAIISINKTLINFKIVIVPLASSNYKIKKKQIIISVGCAQAHWASLFKGHFISYQNREAKNSDFLFLPRPEGGRSGSAIFDEKGKMIVGLLWGVSDTGIAKSLQAIYFVVEKKDCPNGSCPIKEK